jgi:hypothetical protein
MNYLTHERPCFINTTNSNLFISFHEISVDLIRGKIESALTYNLDNIKSIKCEIKWIENWWFARSAGELISLDQLFNDGRIIQSTELNGFLDLLYNSELSQDILIHCLDDAESEIAFRRNSIFIDLLVPLIADIELNDGKMISIELLSDDFGIGSPARMANEIIGAINHWINIKPQIAIHHHLSQGNEMGTVEMLNSFHFADESELYMRSFSEFYESNTGKFVSVFEIVDSWNSFTLCQIKEVTDFYFIIQDPGSFLRTQENAIDQYFQENNLEYEAMDVIENSKFELLKGLVIDLQSDMIYCECFEQIELSRYEINSLIQKNGIIGIIDPSKTE